MKELVNDTTIISWIGKTSKLIQIFIQNELVNRNIDLTTKQLLLLKFLHSKDGQVQNDLAIITGRNKGSLVRLIHSMEKKGLVIREKDPNDKLINRIYLTKHGKEVFNKTQPTLNHVVKCVHGGISDYDKQQLVSTLHRVQDNIKEQYNSIGKS